METLKTKLISTIEHQRKIYLLKLFLLQLNYFLLIFQLIAYKNEGHQTAGSILSLILLLDRFFTIIITVTQGGLNWQKKLKNLIGNLLFFDCHRGIEVDCCRQCFCEQGFIDNLNFTSHLINNIPLSYNFWIINGDQENKLIYTLTTIYGLGLVIYFDFICFKHFFEYKQIELTSLAKLKFIILSFCKKLCYFLTFSSLINRIEYFMLIINVIYILININYWSIINPNHFYSAELQIYYYPSQYHLKYQNLIHPEFIFSSFYSSVCLLILFLFDIVFSNSDKSMYRIVQTVLFLLVWQEIFLSFKNFILYKIRGPFMVEKQLNLKDHNEITNFQKQLEQKTFIKRIYLDLISERSLDDNPNELEQLLIDLIKKGDYYVEINLKIKNQSIDRFLIRKSTEIQIDLPNGLFFGIVNILSKIVNYDYNKKNMSFNINLRQKISMFLGWMIFKEMRQYCHKKIIKINNQEPKILTEFYSIIMSCNAFYKYIIEFIPLNHSAVIYDLLDR